MVFCGRSAVRILRHKDLTPWNSLSLPATASALLNVVDDAVLPEALAWSLEKGMPLVPIGQGSNIVLAGDVDALVVRMEKEAITLVEALHRRRYLDALGKNEGKNGAKGAGSDESQ